MSMSVLRTVSLLAATTSMGLAAGTFAIYAHTIMPGLSKTDDQTFVEAFQSIDHAIINPWFIGGTFLSALFFTVVAALANRGQQPFRWTIAGLVAYLVVVVITVSIHVPLNNAIKAAGHVDHINLIDVRSAFDETKWAMWNVIRVTSSLTGFVCLLWALVLLGRSSIATR